MWSLRLFPQLALMTTVRYFSLGLFTVQQMEQPLSYKEMAQFGLSLQEI